MHTWFAKVTNRTYLGRGCPYCSGRFAIPGETDLATLSPTIAAQLVDQSLATTVTAGSGRKLEWCCKKGHTWFATVVARMSGQGCPYCSGRYAIPGETDLATTNKTLAAQLVDQSLATTVTAGSGRKLEWCCDAGHTWFATVISRDKGSGCPYCSGYLRTTGENDFASLYPAIAAQAVDQEIIARISPNSHRKLEWCCDAGHTWFATVANRTRIGVGCPSCAPHGYNPSKPGTLYLQAISPTSAPAGNAPSLAEPVAYKIGITNNNVTVRTSVQQRRISADYTITTIHQIHGDGATIRQAERAILNHWRATLNLPAYFDKTDMPYGHTETITADAYDAQQLITLMRQQVDQATQTVSA